MCIPAMLSYGGAAVGGMGALYEGNAESQQAARNAEVAGKLASDAVARGEGDVSRYRVQEAQVLARQRLAYAGAGVDINSGTPVDVAAATEMAGKQDIEQIRRNAAMESWGYKVQQQDFTTQSSLAKTRGRYRAASTVLSSLTDMVNQGAGALSSVPVGKR